MSRKEYFFNTQRSLSRMGVPWKPEAVSKAGLNEDPGLEREVTANGEGSRQASPANRGFTVRHQCLG